jgi:Flp pilus assembly protein TadB
VAEYAIWLRVGGLVLIVASLWVLLSGRRSLGGAAARSSWRFIERQRVSLAQAGVGRLPIEAWIAARAAVSLLVGVAAWLYFGVFVLAPLTALVVHHLIGLGLERRRRRSEELRQQALLDAIRYGAAVMSRAGNATQMTRALAETGPVRARQIFAAVVEEIDRGQGAASLAGALQRQAELLADPLFDDFVVAVTVNARYGAKLVPALETQLMAWENRLALRREARALRAGQELAVRILPLSLFGFLIVLQLISPELLLPLRSPLGELLMGAAVASMTYGYRVLQRMASETRIDRLEMATPA